MFCLWRVTATDAVVGAREEAKTISTNFTVDSGQIVDLMKRAAAGFNPLCYGLGFFVTALLRWEWR